MTEHEVYDLAGSIFTSLTEDMNFVYYKDIDGELTLQWIERPEIQAEAHSIYTKNSVANHSISISYALLWQLYLDVKHYFEYLEGGRDDEAFRHWWGDDKHLDMLLSMSTKEQCIQNLYMSAITWVYFHELGHLSQEHGVIRSAIFPDAKNTIVECDLNNNVILSEEASALWHVTEISADYFATSTCVAELIRHFKTLNEARLAVNFLATGMAIVLHRFNGQNLFEKQKVPTGSHPKPFVRLELMMPLISEMLSDIDTDERVKLVTTCGRASTTVSLFWLRGYTSFETIPQHYIIEGMLNRPGVIDYMKHVVKKWDEIYPKIQKIKRFGYEWQMLRFGNGFRDVLKNAKSPE